MNFNRKLVFDAAREIIGRSFTQPEVEKLDAAITLAMSKPTALAGPATFFRNLRLALGPLDQGQVDGINALLAAMGEARWPVAWTAYGLATAWWETNKTMQPVEEAYYLGDKAAAYRKGLRYYPWHGRGYVQLTWEKNFRWADEECGLCGKLLADPALAMQPEIAAQILVKGMEQGAFTGKRLADYLPLSGSAGLDAYKSARRIINGTDRAQDIAKIALTFDAALVAGGWA